MSQDLIQSAVARAMAAAPKSEIDKLELAARAIAIDSEDAYRQGGLLIAALARAKKSWGGFWSPGTILGDLLAATKAAHDTIAGFRSSVENRFDEARAALERRMAQFRSEEDGRNQARAAALTRQAAEVKRALLLQGRVAESQLVPERPYLPAPERKIEGVSQVPVLVATVTDRAAFLRAVGEGSVPLTGSVNGKEMDLIEVRASVLVAIRKRLGKSFDPPGVSFTEKISYRSRPQ